MSVSVKYSGPWAEASGYAQANRNIIRSLVESGVDVVTERQVYAKQVTDYGTAYKLAAERENKHTNYAIKVLHITPNVYHKHKEVGKYHIGHLFWETTGMSKEWSWYLDEVKEIWTGCKFNEDCFRSAGFDGKVFRFPQPIDSDPSGITIPINNASGFVFYSIFQWIERKNPRALLEAYWREFQNNEDVTLVVKTYGLSMTNTENEKITTQISDWKKEIGFRRYPRTLIIDYLLTDRDIHNLHTSGDCFVSAHRGEGWGIPQAEALAHGKPVISTNLGGVHEWCPDDAMYKISYKMVKVVGMDWAEQYNQEQEWAEVDLGELRKSMRFVFDNRDKAKETGERGRQFTKEKLNFKIVGEMMKQRLQEIYSERGLK